MNEKNNNLILFATFWNEIDWIKPSLEQIDLINPVEVIICDGCFDSKYPLHSTDGTYEIIQDYVQSRPNVRFISPARVTRVKGLFEMANFYKRQSILQKVCLPRFRNIIKCSKINLYHVNQAITFNRMIDLSNEWRNGNWFMTYDCDQFYSDNVIDCFHNLNNFTSYDLITATEFSFYNDFNNYTTDFETRRYNNMPHRIRSDTLIIPTRCLKIQTFFMYYYYVDIVKSKHIGCYFHYKIKSPKREEQTYIVGNRSIAKDDKRSDKFGTCRFHRLKEEHPKIVKKYLPYIEKKLICQLEKRPNENDYDPQLH